MTKNLSLRACMLSLLAGVGSFNGDDSVDNKKPDSITALTEKRTNFKSVYTQADYYPWDAYKPYANTTGAWNSGTANYNPTTTGAVSASCKNCPTKEEMIKYINAGAVYWDGGFGTVENGLQTFTTPKESTSSGSTETQVNHEGIWLLKKVYWPETMGTTDYKGTTAITADNASIRTSGKYCFLPAAGYYSFGSFRVAGSYGYYWSSIPNDDGDSAYYLNFFDGYVAVDYGYCGRGYLPMIAE